MGKDMWWRRTASPSPSAPAGRIHLPKVEGLGNPRKVSGFARGSPFEERLPPVRGKMSRSDKKGNLASECETERVSQLKQNHL